MIKLLSDYMKLIKFFINIFYKEHSEISTCPCCKLSFLNYGKTKRYFKKPKEKSILCLDCEAECYCDMDRSFKIHAIKDTFHKKILLDTINKAPIEIRVKLQEDITNQIRNFIKKKKIASYEDFMQKWYVGIQQSGNNYRCLFDKKPKSAIFQTELFYFCGISKEEINNRLKSVCDILETL